MCFPLLFKRPCLFSAEKVLLPVTLTHLSIWLCRYRLTALAVDNAAGPYKNYTVVFVGSEAGVVLKVLAKTSSASLNDSLLLEEIDVFNKAK